MRPGAGLSRQIVLAVGLLVLIVVLGITAGSYAFYALMFTFAPQGLGSPGSWLPTGAELAWIVLTTLAALVLAILVGIRLARRILDPLNSVALSLRRISEGDLGARAAGADRSLGEVSQLVEDFNTMAEWLQRMEKEQVFWNAAIAHELRTPVTILRGRIQGLAEGVFAPDPALFRKLLAQVEHVARLLEDLRVVGLADGGHLSLQRVPCRLADEVRDVLALMEAELRSKGLEPVAILDGGIVDCDAARIRQALLALLDNALRHALPGRLEIRLAVISETCSLSVSDAGPGVDPACAARIFDAFQRGQDARRDGGSGLGLAVVRAIAQAHGGKARCDSAPGGGASFVLAWPAAV